MENRMTVFILDGLRVHGHKLTSLRSIWILQDYIFWSVSTFFALNRTFRLKINKE